MSQREIRRHHRVPYLGRVFISWEDAGVPKYAPAKCLDVSEAGMRVEMPESIPIRTNVWLRADQIKLGGSAIVKHVERQGTHHVLGLQLSEVLRERTLKVIRDAETSGKQVSLG
jgi:hypothetical protein